MVMPGGKRILIVDDEEDICAILKYNLEKAGFSADTALSAEEALTLGLESYDLLLLDVMMAGMSGFDLARKMKETPDTVAIPIIFVTAKDTEDDTLSGFSLGADDYVSKPFSVKEVVSRVKAVLRRTSAGERRGDVLQCEGLIVNLERKSVSVDGDELILTKTEFEILRFLLSNSGQVFSREDIISKVWRDDVIVTDRTVDVNIARLRKKIGAYGGRIVARHGFGYCFDGK